MRTSYNSTSSARRFSSWLLVMLGLAGYLGLLYGLTMLPLQLEVPLPQWGAAVVRHSCMACWWSSAFAGRPSELARRDCAAEWPARPARAGPRSDLRVSRPALVGRPLPWVLPPPLPELVGLILLLVPLRDLLRVRPRSARERLAAAGRAPSAARGRTVPLRPAQPAPAESRYSPSEATAIPQVEGSPEPVVSAAPIAPPIPPAPFSSPTRWTRCADAGGSTGRAPAGNGSSHPTRRSDVVLRIALDRIMDQLPPGTFLAPEDEVAASLRDPGYLLIPGQLVVTQLSEGIARWRGVTSSISSRRDSSGSAAPRSASTSATGFGCRLTRWWASCRTSCSSRTPRRSSSLVSIGSRCRSIRSRNPRRPERPARARAETPPPIIERPSVAPAVATPARVVPEPSLAPRLEPSPVSAPEGSLPIEEPVASALEPEPLPAPIHVPEPEPVAAPAPALVIDEATVRVSFDRVAVDLPADAFRGPLDQVAARMHQPGALLIPLSRVLPQLGEGLIRVGWDVVAPQFPREQMAVSDAEMIERLPNGIELPLDEVIRQISPDLFVTGGPAVDVRGLESFPAPFQPLLSDPAPEPAPAAAAESPVAIAETGCPSPRAGTGDGAVAGLEPRDRARIGPGNDGRARTRDRAGATPHGGAAARTGRGSPCERSDPGRAPAPPRGAGRPVADRGGMAAGFRADAGRRAARPSSPTRPNRPRHPRRSRRPNLTGRSQCRHRSSWRRRWSPPSRLRGDRGQ